MNSAVDSAGLGNALAREINAHLSVIAAIGPRPDGSDADQELVAYIETALAKQGLPVAKLPIDVPVAVAKLWMEHFPNRVVAAEEAIAQATANNVALANANARIAELEKQLAAKAAI